MTHLVDTKEPLVSGLNLYAMCGKLINNAQWFFAFDGEVCGRSLAKLIEEVELNSLSICRKCLKAEFTGRYLSGVRSGEAA